MYAATASGGPNGNRHGFDLRHALAGLQAGVLGSLALFACVMVGSLWEGRSIWVVPNLFATTFFGSDVYRNHLMRTSWTGIALIVAVYGVLGALWGSIWRDERTSSWLTLYGAIAGLGVYFVFYSFLWRHVNPLIALYAPDRQLQLGHVLWGMVLARSPVYARRIAHSIASPSASSSSIGGTPTQPAPGDRDAASQEVRSGEVIR